MWVVTVPEEEQLGGELAVGLARGQWLGDLEHTAAEGRDARAGGAAPAVDEAELATLLLGAALAVGLAPPAFGARCHFQGEPQTGEEDCGPVNMDPPPSAPLRRAAAGSSWASGYDLNPFSADRLGIYVAQTDGTADASCQLLEQPGARVLSPPRVSLPDDHPRSRPTA